MSSTQIVPRSSVQENTLQLVLRKDGAPVDYEQALQLAPSLAAAMMATGRALRSIDEEVERVDKEIVELEERVRLHEELGLPARGVKATITRRQSLRHGLLKRRAAHERHYLEVPDMGGDPLRMGDYEDRWGAETLGADVPLDVLQALKAAKESGVFDEFRIYTPAAHNIDPMIVGVIRRNAGSLWSRAAACFYVASWR